jgi:hypothetical protein
MGYDIAMTYYERDELLQGLNQHLDVAFCRGFCRLCKIPDEDLLGVFSADGCGHDSGQAVDLTAANSRDILERLAE